MLKDKQLFLALCRYILELPFFCDEIFDNLLFLIMHFQHFFHLSFLFIKQVNENLCLLFDNRFIHVIIDGVFITALIDAINSF
ncbi:Uncharacterised protein [Mycobacteroides abscessus subsp. abscessus]|nr:Uncharacterised protein [Mycobacteroides abscessus subsp. abscessus]